MVPNKLEKRNDVLYGKLVPNSGNSDTLEGEMLRAINKIIYRYYNDGDYYHEGYGVETAAPAHSFLLNLDYSDGYESNKDLLELQIALFRILDPENRYYEKVYEDSLNDSLIKILDYIEGRKKYATNTYDMLDSTPMFEEDDEDDEDDEDYTYFDDDYDFARGGEIPITKLKKYKSIIEKHKAFNKFYEDTGEDYDYALEMWIPKYYELVDVYSEQEKDNLIKALNKLNSTYAKGGAVKVENNRTFVTDKKGNQYVYVHFLGENEHYLVPYIDIKGRGKKYWEYHFIPKETWIDVDKIKDFSAYPISQSEFSELKNKGKESLKEILYKYHASFSKGGSTYAKGGEVNYPYGKEKVEYLKTKIGQTTNNVGSPTGRAKLIEVKPNRVTWEIADSSVRFISSDSNKRFGKNPVGKTYIGDIVDAYDSFYYYAKGGEVKDYNLMVRKTPNSSWEYVNKIPMTYSDAEKMYEEYNNSGIKHHELDIHIDLPFAKGGYIDVEVPKGNFRVNRMYGLDDKQKHPKRDYYASDDGNSVYYIEDGYLYEEVIDSNGYFRSKTFRPSKTTIKYGTYAKGGINKRRLKKGDTVYVAGKRHTNKSLGNTYHTVRVYVNDRLIGKTESPVYGYENAYLDTGRKILFEKYNKPYGFEIDSPLWKLKDKNVKFLYSVKDYNTKKELY